MAPECEIKVLFLSYDASQTGGPVLLKRYLNWLKNKEGISCDVLFNSPGKLLCDFNILGRTWVLDHNPFECAVLRISKVNSVIKKIVNFYIKRKLKRQFYDLVYINSAASLRLFIRFRNIFSGPVVLHLHEYELSLKNFPLKEVVNRIDRFIVVADCIKQLLIESYGITEGKIEVVPGFLSTEDVLKQSEEEINLKDEIGAQRDSMIVGACGSIFPYKGPDLFIQIAKKSIEIMGCVDIHFVWLGENPYPWIFDYYEYDLKRLGIEGRVHFIGPRDNPFPYLAAFDVFVLSSRQDSFPLVCLEAATLGKPIICFENSGGAPDFVDNDIGFVVPYINTDAAANKVVLLHNNITQVRNMGKCAKRKAQLYDEEQICPKLLNSLLNTIQR